MNECQRETEKVSLRKRKMIVRESDRGGEKEYERKRVIEDCCVAWSFTHSLSCFFLFFFLSFVTPFLLGSRRGHRSAFCRRRRATFVGSSKKKQNKKVFPTKKEVISVSSSLHINFDDLGRNRRRRRRRRSGRVIVSHEPTETEHTFQRKKNYYFFKQVAVAAIHRHRDRLSRGFWEINFPAFLPTRNLNWNFYSRKTECLASIAASIYRCKSIFKIASIRRFLFGVN